MGLFVYTQKGSIISMVDLPTTEIIEPFFFEKIQQRNLLIYRLDDYSQKNRHKQKSGTA